MKPKGVHHVDMITAMESRLEAMIDKKFRSLNLSPSPIATQTVMFYEFHNERHPNYEHPSMGTAIEHVDYWGQ